MTTFLGGHDEVDDHIIDLVSRGYDVRLVRAGLDKASVLNAFAEGLGFADWFGHNWDALVDALRDLTNDEDRRIELVWDHVHELRDTAPKTYATALEILEQVAGERSDLHLTVVDR